MKTKLLLLLFFVSVFAYSQEISDPISIVDSQKKAFTISPNPAKDNLNIRLRTAEDGLRVEIYDVLGKCIYKGIITQLESSINVSHWKSGVYLVRISDTKNIHTKRFIKQ